MRDHALRPALRNEVYEHLGKSNRGFLELVVRDAPHLEGEDVDAAVGLAGQPVDGGGELSPWHDTTLQIDLSQGLDDVGDDVLLDVLFGLLFARGFFLVGF
jgi:hypothetical protein